MTEERWGSCPGCGADEDHLVLRRWISYEGVAPTDNWRLACKVCGSAGLVARTRSGAIEAWNRLQDAMARKKRIFGLIQTATVGAQDKVNAIDGGRLRQHPTFRPHIEGEMDEPDQLLHLKGEVLDEVTRALRCMKEAQRLLLELEKRVRAI